MTADLGSRWPSPFGVCVQVSDLAGFMCSEGEITHKYKYKLLRAAFSHLPSAKDFAIQMPTKVCSVCFSEPLQHITFPARQNSASPPYACLATEIWKNMQLCSLHVLQVTIDSQGIMKVMHMVSLSGNGVSQGGSYQNTTNFSQSQAAARKGRVQFMLLPQDALIDYDPDD